jgi:environmental stress-induced protein Ves
MHKITTIFQNFKKMPWKNGMGITYEVDIFPLESTLTDLNFDFRISMAQVSSENQFSKFLGMERYLTVIKGAGIKFNEKQLSFLDIIQFSGEAEIASGPLKAGEENLDLGVIYNPNKVKCEMKKLELINDARIKIIDRLNYFFQIKNDAQVDCLKIVLDPNELEAMIDLPYGTWIYIAIKRD